ncbi:ATP-binding protein [Pseudorhodobacter sp.]|uniref:ATP-binding protein n=1 Tax=Pseudorhodobacter sp. TaxID=1934400 RepID=UPI002AFEC442|nr:ATP-binding protein [Pseudorhodobacter sp.]
MELNNIETVTGSILRDVTQDILEGAGLGILRGPAGIGKSFALDLITEELEALGAMVVRITVSPATGGSISSFTRAVLAQYRIETGSTADGVEAMAELLRGYPFRDIGPQTVFIVDEAQELKPAVLETIRSLWDRGDQARLGDASTPAFGCVLVGNEMFMGKGGNLRVASFRPLMSRVTHNVQLPRPNKKEVAALATSLFPTQSDLIEELKELGAATGNLRTLATAARRSRQSAKDEPVNLALLRQIIRMMMGAK